jgi:hypothetical protein
MGAGIVRTIRLLILLHLCFSGQAQTFSKLREIKFRGVTGLTVDRLGNFFLTFKNGKIKKYDPDGKQLAVLKSKLGEPTLIEPWFHPSIFTYYRNEQQWITFDRQFKNPQVNQLDPSVAVEPYLVCPTNDNKLLVFDKADYTVKKINRFTNELIFEFAIDTTTFSKQVGFTFIREYQSIIFLLDKTKGIHLYNSIGKRLNTIAGPDLLNFGFYGEELIYSQNDRVIFFDLYTERVREVPSPGHFNQLIITDERLIGLNQKGAVEIFRFMDQGK